jgi:hypothetical protein
MFQVATRMRILLAPEIRSSLPEKLGAVPINSVLRGSWSARTGWGLELPGAELCSANCGGVESEPSSCEALRGRCCA